MDPRSRIGPRQTALARAGRLTTELIELVEQLRAAVDDRERRPSPETGPPSGRLQSGDLRAAMSRANRRSARQVPHLFS